MRLAHLTFETGAALAPMAGVADRAFRQLCREMGAVYTVGEMVSAKGLLQGSAKTRELLEMGPGERPGAVQLFGDEPEKETQEAQEEAPQPQDPGPPPPAPRELTLSQDHPVCQLWSLHAFTAKRLPQPRLCLTDPPDLPLDEQAAEKELARLQSAVTDSAGSRLALLDSGRASDLDAQVVVFISAGGMAAWLLVYPPAGPGADGNRPPRGPRRTRTRRLRTLRLLVRPPARIGRKPPGCRIPFLSLRGKAKP